MNKHTPGPWVVGATSFDIFEDGTSEHIARCWKGERKQLDHIANARLISAAPDLLEACGRALYHMTLRGWATTEGHELHGVYEQVKAAIKKAEGGE